MSKLLSFLTSLSLMLFFFFQSSAHAQVGRRIYNVTSYGAAGNGKDDARAAIQRTIDAAIASGPNAEVYLPAGTFFLNCKDTAESACLRITSARNLSLRGAGKNVTKFLVGDRLKGLLDVSTSTDITLTDIAVDYSELPFTQGTVTITNPSAGALQFTIDAGYPAPSFLTPNTWPTTFSMVFDKTAKLKKNVREEFFIKGLVQVSANNPNLWHVSLDSVEGIAPGDKFVLQLRKSSLFHFYQNKNLKLKQTLVLASPGLVSAWVQNEGQITIDALEIRRSQGRMISSTADGIHMVDNVAKVIIKNSYFEGMADDAINTRSTGFKISSVQSGSNLTFVNYGVRGFAVGQELQVVNQANQLPRGSARIVQIRRVSNTVNVILDRTISSVGVGDIIFNADFAAPNLIVTGNTFSNFRGIFRIRSRGAMFFGNTILDEHNAKVFVSADIAPLWIEGPSLVNALDGVYFLNNTIQNGSIKLLQVNYQPVAPTLIGEDAMKTHPLVFDPSSYLSFNPDLIYLTNPADLKAHWVNSGIQEGRRGSAGFFAPEYISLYSDLQSALGNDYTSALWHYLLNGYGHENRHGSLLVNTLVFDAASYRAFNPDLGGMSYLELSSHWIKKGFKEGRQAHLQFHSRDYLNLNLDLSKAFGAANYQKGLFHYVSNGALENRKATSVFHPLVFNSTDYAFWNSDLVTTGMSDLELWAHWYNSGRFEGRRARTSFSSVSYLARYPDLARIYGSNYARAVEHFVFNGSLEGRSGAP